MLIVTAIATLSFLVFTHNLKQTYQKHIEQTTKQLEDQKAQQRLDSDKKLHELEQLNQQKDQQIQDLQKQVTARKAYLASIQATQSRPTAQVAYSTNCEAYRGLISQYTWNTAIAMAIMKAESGCNPTASSPTCDHGLMQINCVHSSAVGGNLALLNDPATNIRVAYAVYSGAGWSAWTTYTSGAFLRYL